MITNGVMTEGPNNATDNNINEDSSAAVADDEYNAPIAETDSDPTVVNDSGHVKRLGQVLGMVWPGLEAGFIADAAVHGPPPTDFDGNFSRGDFVVGGDNEPTIDDEVSQVLPRTGDVTIVEELDVVEEGMFLPTGKFCRRACGGRLSKIKLFPSDRDMREINRRIVSQEREEREGERAACRARSRAKYLRDVWGDTGGERIHGVRVKMADLNSRKLFIRRWSCGQATLSSRFWSWASLVDWINIWIIFIMLIALYLFLLFLELLTTSFKLLGGRKASGFFNDVSDPFGALCAGILVTVLVQSSSTTTSIIVGLVGAGQITVRNAIPMVLGANIGTSVTNTLVSMTHIGRRREIGRAFAGATVHDIFNILSVAWELPLEYLSGIGSAGGFLYWSSYGLTELFLGGKGANFDGPLKQIVSPLASLIVDVDKTLFNSLAECDTDDKQVKDISPECVEPYTIDTCSFDPSTPNATVEFVYVPEEGESHTITVDPLSETCIRAGNFNSTLAGGSECLLCKSCQPYCSLKTCNEITSSFSYQQFCDALTARNEIPYGQCPGMEDCSALPFEYCVAEAWIGDPCASSLLDDGIFYDWGASDALSGGIVLGISVLGILFSLVILVRCLQRLIRGKAAYMLNRALSFNPYLSILTGLCITIVVQSSSITTATLTPLVGIGTITLQQMFPLTLGANVGTTMTALIASLVSGTFEALQIALVHLLFNIYGILFIFPVPGIRQIPLSASEWLGSMAFRYAAFPIMVSSKIPQDEQIICRHVCAGAFLQVKLPKTNQIRC